MKRTTKWIVLCCALIPGLMLNAATAPSTKAPAAATPSLSDLFTNSIVARGKGVSVSRSQLDEEVVRVKAQRAAQGLSTPQDVDQDVLDSMIKTQLVLSKATEADRAKGKAQYETNIAAIKKTANLTDEEYDQKLSQQLRLLNVTKGEWEKLNIDQLTIPIVLERELKGNVTEADAKKFYDENTAYFEHPETVRVSHILLTTQDSATREPLSEDKKQAKRKQMEDLLKRARAGEDFTKLADQYSEDPGVKQNHGEYKFSREDPFVKEFKDTAFALTNGQVSDVVTTEYGYHILKLHEKIPAKKESFAGLETKTAATKPDGQSVTVKEILSTQSIRKQLPEYFEKLEKDAGVEILDPKLKRSENVFEMPRTPSAAASTNAPPK